ncbi:MAG: porin family protein [Rhizobiaceae bacterium]
MRTLKKTVLLTAAMIGISSVANAADIIPDIVEAPQEVMAQSNTGWYLRGDIGYASLKSDGVLYHQGSASLTGSFEQHDLDDTWMLGGGVGYQVTDYFRVDATIDHYFKTDFTGVSATGATTCTLTGATLCNFTDNSELSVTTYMLNAYMDLGTYSKITPYVGFGLGAAQLHWTDLINSEVCVTGCTGSVSTSHFGEADLRFAYSLHAGASYDINANWKWDAGYSYTHIEGGPMFHFEAGNANTGRQGYDEGLDVHAFKLGLRYQFGGGTIASYDDGSVYK